MKRLLTLILVLISTTGSTAFANTSSTNRISANIDPTFQTQSTLNPSSQKTILEFDLKNRASTLGTEVEITSLTFGYRSSDLKKDEIQSLILEIQNNVSPYSNVDYIYPKAGSTEFTLNLSYSGPITLKPNQSAKLALTVLTNSVNSGATLGDKFMFYLKEVQAHEKNSGKKVFVYLNKLQSQWFKISSK